MLGVVLDLGLRLNLTSSPPPSPPPLIINLIDAELECLLKVRLSHQFHKLIDNLGCQGVSPE